eukprot:m.48400 g.48400  ORF g.48400 m.48400 type:complete len:470 (-) comp6031_c0_seq1:42-1451(-)
MRLCVLALLAAVAHASFSDTVPPRLRGGLMYRHIVAHERKALKSFNLATNTTPNYYAQLIDHSNPARGTFNQKYYVDYSQWDPATGPVFLYIGGEGPVSNSPGGYAAVVGAQYRALLITLEHRYYGVSLPAPLTDRETLKTLSVETALKDLVAFINFAKTSIVGREAKWVSIGGSYPGALSAWMRIVHPELIAMSWSSSGVVKAIFDFTEYDRQVAFDLTPECATAIRTINQIAERDWDDAEKRRTMYALFNTPAYFTKEDFLYMVVDAAAAAAQYGNKALMCRAILPQSADPMKQFAEQWVIPFLGAGFGAQCIYSTVCLSSAEYSSQWANQYPWAYQCCSELAYWQTGYPGSLRSQLVSTEYFMNQCRSAFGANIYPNVTIVNERYGGANAAAAKNATKIIALNGSDDPWQNCCVEKTLAASYPERTAACNGCGHCGDLRTPTNTTNFAVRSQQQLISSYIGQWLQQ